MSITQLFYIAQHRCVCGYTYWQPMGRALPHCTTCGRGPHRASRVSEWEKHVADLTPIQDRAADTDCGACYGCAQSEGVPSDGH